jgi:hypothetical protein
VVVRGARCGYARVGEAQRHHRSGRDNGRRTTGT